MMTRIPEKYRPQLSDLRVHEAAHAVVALELGLQVDHVRFTNATGQGRCRLTYCFTTVASLTTPEAREAIERDAMAVHAGYAAQRVFAYERTLYVSPRHDLDLVRSLLGLVEDDERLILAWSTYLAERAIAYVQRDRTWRCILALADHLPARGRLTGLQVSSFLAQVGESVTSQHGDGE
jgi:hypothetical protein